MSSPLHITAASGQLDAVKIILADNTVNIDVEDKYGNTPFMLACHGGHIEIAKQLYSHGANSNKQNNLGYTALMLVCGANPYEEKKMKNKKN